MRFENLRSTFLKKPYGMTCVDRIVMYVEERQIIQGRRAASADQHRPGTAKDLPVILRMKPQIIDIDENDAAAPAYSRSWLRKHTQQTVKSRCDFLRLRYLHAKITLEFRLSHPLPRLLRQIFIEVYQQGKRNPLIDDTSEFFSKITK